MIGNTYYRLTVESFSHRDQRQRKHYRCRCQCGNVKTVQGSLLTSGNTKSCGCLGAEVRCSLTKLPNNGCVINHLILQYKRHARSRGYSFNLSREMFDSLVRQACHYCGVPPSNLKRTKNCKEGFLYSGLDRKDPERGYERGNTVPCCAMCNQAKRNFTERVFLGWIRRVATYQDAMAEQWGSLI